MLTFYVFGKIQPHFYHCMTLSLRVDFRCSSSSAIRCPQEGCLPRFQPRIDFIRHVLFPRLISSLVLPVVVYQPPPLPCSHLSPHKHQGRGVKAKGVKSSQGENKNARRQFRQPWVKGGGVVFVCVSVCILVSDWLLSGAKKTFR